MDATYKDRDRDFSVGVRVGECGMAHKETQRMKRSRDRLGNWGEYIMA